MVKLVPEHPPTKKVGMLTDVAPSEEKASLFESLKKWNLNIPFRNDSSLEAICNSLSKFGLSKNEAKIYVYLAKFREQKAQKISKSLSLHRTETYKILRKLEEKGLVCRVLEKPIRFAAVQVDKALENLIYVNKQKIAHLEEERRRIVSKWLSLSTPAQDPEMLEEFIQVLKGRHQIYAKVHEAIKNAEDKILMAVSDGTLLQMFYSGALDDLARRSKKIKVSLITDSSLKDSSVARKMELAEIIHIDFTDLPIFIISNGHLLLFLNDEGSNSKNGSRALWTNQKDIIKILEASFLKISRDKVVLATTL